MIRYGTAINFWPMADDAWKYEDDLLLVEAYGPDGRPSDRLDLLASRLGDVQLRGVLVVPGDEVVFYLVTAATVEDVRRAFGGVGLDSVRVVPACWAERRRAPTWSAASLPGSRPSRAG